VFAVRETRFTQPQISEFRLVNVAVSTFRLLSWVRRLNPVGKAGSFVSYISSLKRFTNPPIVASRVPLAASIRFANNVFKGKIAGSALRAIDVPEISM